MVELRKDERKVTKEGEDFVFAISQEQVYPAETVEKMKEGWLKEYAEKKKWLDDFGKFKEEAHKATDNQLETMKAKIEKDLENIEQGLVIWDVK